MLIHTLTRRFITVLLLIGIHHFVRAQVRTKGVIVNISLHSQIPSGYDVTDSISCDLNQDGRPDKILVMFKNEVTKNSDQIQNGPLFQILKGNANGTFSVWSSNENLIRIDNSCPATGYNKVVVKGTVFTIESDVCAGWRYVHQYITFKYDAKMDKIKFYRYGETYTDRIDPDKDIPAIDFNLTSIKDLTFNEVTDDLIDQVRQKRPR